MAPVGRAGVRPPRVDSSDTESGAPRRTRGSAPAPRWGRGGRRADQFPRDPVGGARSGGRRESASPRECGAPRSRITRPPGSVRRGSRARPLSHWPISSLIAPSCPDMSSRHGRHSQRYISRRCPMRTTSTRRTSPRIAYTTRKSPARTRKKPSGPSSFTTPDGRGFVARASIARAIRAWTSPGSFARARRAAGRNSIR